MKAKLNKDQLRQLAECRGHLEDDTGLIYTGFVGHLVLEDHLYHGELGFREPDPEAEYVSFKISSITGTGVDNGESHAALGSDEREHDDDEE